MASQVVQLKHIGEVTFSQNKKSKGIKVSVKPDKSVLVSYPFYITEKEALTFVNKNVEWIRRQQRKMEACKTNIKAGSELKTKLFTIRFHIGERNHMKKNGSIIDVYTPGFTSDSASVFIEYCLTEIYRHEAKRLLPARLTELAQRHGFSYNKVTIRNNRRNWGSCSSQNNISLNLQMMKLPVKLIDYVLLHELVHTEIKNHGAEFWERLNGVTGGQARKLAKEVKQYSTYPL